MGQNRINLIALMLLFLATICSPVAAQRELKKGESMISGRVVFADTGTPVRRASVRLTTNVNYPASRFTSTNSRAGEFFVKCPPGDYLVFAWAGGGQPMQSIENFVRSNLASARRITLRSREEKRIELTVTKPKR